MAVQASTIFSQVRSILDDDESIRYTESKDLVPAINAAIDYITAVFSAAFEQKKLQPFMLSELTAVWIYTPVVTGGTAKIDLDSYSSHVFNDEVWAIVGVDPNPTVSGTPEVLSESHDRFADRVTLEKFNYSSEDPFVPGYADVPTDFARVCYTGPGSYFNDGKPYILLRPGSLFSDSGSRVGVWVLLRHTQVSSSTSELYLPVTVHQLIVQKMVQFITFQSDDERLYKITDKEVKELIQLMN